MKIDYAENIKYIIDNFDKLKNRTMYGSDLVELQNLLKLVKSQVQQHIIQEVVQKNPDLPHQIEEAKSKITSRIDTLRKMQEEKQGELEYPEFVSKEKEEGVLEALQAQVEAKDRGVYDRKKSDWETIEKPKIERQIEQFKNMIKKLEDFETSLDKPEEFINKIMIQSLGQRFSEEYQRLMNVCATNMAYGYMGMESARIGETKTEYDPKDSNQWKLHSLRLYR